MAKTHKGFCSRETFGSFCLQCDSPVVNPMQVDPRDAEIARLKAEVARLREALTFYATANDARWMGDGGERARAALGTKETG